MYFLRKNKTYQHVGCL